MSCLYNLSTSFTVTLTTICCISGFLAAVENTFVLLLVHKIHSVRTTARYFMTSLAAAELFSGVTGNAFFSLWLILNHLKHGTSDVLWRTETVVWMFTTISVTYNLVNVAVDRYIAITSPLQYYTRMNSTRCLMLIAFTWILAIICASLVYLVPEKDLPQIWIAGSVIAVVIPLCIIAFCYFSIYRAAKITFPMRNNITDVQQMAENRRQRKTACTFGIITGLFIVVFTPSFILNCIQLFNPSLYDEWKKVDLCGGPRREIWICIAVVSYFSALFDPWVYVIRMHDFRVALKELLQSSSRVLMQRKLENCCERRNKRENRIKDSRGIDSLANEEIFDTTL